MSDKVFTRLSSNGLTVAITASDGLTVTADTDVPAGTTWETSEVNHLSLQSGVNGFLNRAHGRAVGGSKLDIGYEEIGCSEGDLRIGIGPDGVHLITVDDGEVVSGRLKEAGVDLLIDLLTAYKEKRDARLSA